MRRPTVDQRSAQHTARGSRPEPAGHDGPAARATVAALPESLRRAEAVGAVVLAPSEAEGIVRRSAGP